MSGQHPDIRGRVADNIALAIEESGLSVAEVARRMGGNEKSVRRWRRGTITPSQNSLARLATVLDVHDVTWFYLPHEHERAAA